MKHYLYAGLLLAGCSLFSVNVQSATLTWDCTNNYWHTITCWNPTGTPTSADIVNVYTVSGLDTLLKIDSTTGNAYADSLNVNATTGTTVTLQQWSGALSAGSETIGSDGTGTFTHASGTNTVTNSLTLGLSFTGHGNYNLSGRGILSASSEVIGESGTGTFTQSGGTHTVTNNITLGEFAGGGGQLILSGGTLDVGGDIVGGDGWSMLKIDGGTLNVAGVNINVGALHLGFATGSNGNYTVTGTDTVTVVKERIGESGTGTFTQSGGTNTIYTSLILGYYATGNGSYDLSGGALSADYEEIGSIGTGTFTQSGGTNTITNTLYLGYGSTGNGSYDLSGTGALSASYEYIGHSGTGTFTQSGGTNTITNTLYLGYGSTGNGSYDLSGTGALSASYEYIGNSGTGTFTQSGGTNTMTTGNLYLGYNVTGNGSYDLSGTGVLSASSEVFGWNGTGTFTQSGGTNTIYTSLILGAKSTGNGSYDLNGGTLSAGYEEIGSNGTGTFTQSGGTNTVTNSLTLGRNAGGNGSYDLSGTGTLSAFDEVIGDLGTGTFTQSGGTNTVTNNLNLGTESTGNGSYDLNGGTLSASTAHIGNSGIGSLNISNGGVASSTDAYLAYSSGASGTATLSGTGSAWNNSNNLYVGGSDLSAGGSGTLTVNSGATVDIGNILKVWSTGIVDLNGGTINTDSLINEGSFNFNAGALNFTTDLIMDPAGPLGNSIVLNGLKTLGVSGTTTLNGSSTLTLDGGTFSTGSMVNNGGFAFNSGTFNLTNDNLVIGAGGLFGGLAQFNFGQTVNVSNTATVNAGAILALNNSNFTAGTTTNNGQIVLDGLVASLGGGTVNNAGMLTGSGQISANLNNTTAGEVRVNSGDALVFTGSNNTNDNRISLLGGSVDFTQGLTNNSTGLISGNGTLATGSTPVTGLTNQGNIALSDTSNVIGDVNNTGTIIISGGATATFHDDVVHNGAEIRVSTGSQAVFFGAVSGAGSYTGSGSVFFEGDLNPGNSPALVSIEGDMGLGTNSHTLIEIGGRIQGDEYDAFNIGAELMFGGQLEVSFWDVTDDGLDNPFSVSLGDTFDIFSAETFSGQFDLLTLALLGDGLDWQLDYLVDEIGSIDIARLSVISASTVPVPPAVWLFGSGLIGLIVVARRRHIN